MRLPAPLVEGVFGRRLNRFAVAVEVEEQTVTAHLPNSGRLGELLVPGAAVLLAPRPRPGRRTPYDLLLVRQGGVWVSVDARLPNHLLREALEEGVLPGWEGTQVVQSEVRQGQSRLDFLLREPRGRPVWVEVKSVTLVEGGCGLFPDAPTTRGVRHLQELVQVARRGEGAAVVFVIQRPDARCFQPYAGADATFADTLGRAARAGVEVQAFRCAVSPEEIRITGSVPVDLPDPPPIPSS